jgi:hypothetical protein
MWSSRLFVLIPVRDEEERIGRCLAALGSALARLDRPSTVVVVDDGSTDGTEASVRGLFSESVRFVPTESGGSTGKAAALGRAFRALDVEPEDLLLFLDADVTLAENSLECVLRLAERFEFLSLSPFQAFSGFTDASVQPLVFDLLDTLFPFDRVNDPNDPIAAANGQFLLVRTGLYERLGTHDAVREEIVEDVALAHAAKRLGARVFFESGEPYGITCAMYGSPRELFDGWSKNLFPLCATAPARAARFLLAMSAAVVGSMSALVVAGGMGVTAGVCVFAASTLLLSLGHRRLYTPLHLASGGVIVLAILIRSAWWHRVLRRVRWKRRWIPLPPRRTPLGSSK